METNAQTAPSAHAEYRELVAQVGCMESRGLLPAADATTRGDAHAIRLTLLVQQQQRMIPRAPRLPPTADQTMLLEAGDVCWITRGSSQWHTGACRQRCGDITRRRKGRRSFACFVLSALALSLYPQIMCFRPKVPSPDSGHRQHQLPVRPSIPSDISVVSSSWISASRKLRFCTCFMFRDFFVDRGAAV